MRKIRMLRAMWRGLETDYGGFYTGTKGETPATAKELPTDTAPVPDPTGHAERAARRHVRQLEALGFQVTIEKAA